MEENYINGEKGLKNASFWVINSKNFRGGVFRPPLPQTYSSGKKNDLKRGGGGNDRIALYIPLHITACSLCFMNEIKSCKLPKQITFSGLGICHYQKEFFVCSFLNVMFLNISSSCGR